MEEKRIRRGEDMCRCGRTHMAGASGKLADSLARERENNKKGLLQSKLISVSGCCELNKYDFLDGDEPDTVHPNLWEQAKLNLNYGLYRVNNIVENEQRGADGRYALHAGDVFQIRGYDISNMTLVYDGSGWIVMDVLTTTTIAGVVWQEVVQAYLSKEATIHMVVYSHSHVDHYGGVGGLKSYFAAEGCRILAPEGFMEHAVSENVYAGTAMSRRALYQMGSTLAPGAEGHVDCGLGKVTTKGGNSIIEPSKEIGFEDYGGKKYYEETCREVRLQIQYTPGTEAPAEMNVYLPDQKVLFIAENCAGTLHNALTPRGAEVRDLLAWAGFLDETIVTFPDMEIVCSAHNWPHFGREESIRFIGIQRDMYRYVNNATLHLVNLGYTIDEVGRMISGEDGTMPLPEDFAGEWCSHGFYGTYNHDAKAVYQRYIGWYDGNPAHLNRHKPVERATRYVDAFSAGTILEKAKDAHAAGDDAWAAELFDILMNAEEGKVLPSILKEAKPVYADTLRNLGYQSEAATWRNMYLTGAQEIEFGGTMAGGTLAFADDTVDAMTLEMMLQYMGIMLDSRKLEKDGKRLTVAVSVTADKGTEYANVQIGRGILGYRIVTAADGLGAGADITVRGSKRDFFRAFVDNDRGSLKKVVADASQEELAAGFISGYLTRFPIGFPVMTPRNTYSIQEY